MFGWYIIGYLFAAGTGAGAFFCAATSCLGDAVIRTPSSESWLRTAQGGFFAAPVLVCFSILLLLLDVGSLDRIWYAIESPFRSIMSVGAWLVALLALVSGITAAALAALKRVPRSLLFVTCIVGSLLAFSVMVYAGALLFQMKGIDFWRTPWLVTLFALSSLASGMAVSSAIGAITLPRSERISRQFGTALTLTECLEAISLAGVMVAGLSFSGSAKVSVAMLLVGELALAFWGGVCLVGIAIPVILHCLRRLTPERPAALVSAACVLVGCLLLRYCVIAAGLFEPMFTGLAM